MRFSVQHGLQNALFRRVRFSSPAQTPTRLTQKRTLSPAPHAKAHSDPGTLRKDPRVRLSVRTSYRMRFSVQHGLQNALFRRVRFSLPAQTPTHLTQKRTLSPAPHAKAHSDPGTSRKSAFWPWALTQKRTLSPKSHGKPHSGPGASRKSAFWPRRLTQKRILAVGPHGKPHSVPDASRKSAFCVRAVTKGRALYPRDGYQKPMQSWLGAA